MTSAPRTGLETAALAVNTAARTTAWSNRVRKTDSLTIGGPVRCSVGAELRLTKRSRSQGIRRYPYHRLTSQWELPGFQSICRLLATSGQHPGQHHVAFAGRLVAPAGGTSKATF